MGQLDGNGGLRQGGGHGLLLLGARIVMRIEDWEWVCYLRCERELCAVEPEPEQ